MSNISQSPVVSLIAHVYKHSNEAKGPSWRLLNSALYQCLSVAISSQFKFEPDDFSDLSRFGWGHWCGADSDKMSGERFYSIAVACKNRSAAISFEKKKQRKPYLLNGERLALGSEFRFCEKPVHRSITRDEVLRVWVTHIDADGIGFCWYDNPGHHQRGKPARRWSFTLAELKASQKEGCAALTERHLTEWLSKQEKETTTPSL